MTDTTLALRHLCFTGPKKPPASIEFQSGLNVVYGASETGKSFIFEAINFMLGGNTRLRDIGERVGYDRVFLGLEDSKGDEFTIERSTAGGDFRRYDGLYIDKPEFLEGTVLKAKHNPDRKDNLSRLLLDKIGLDEKRIRKNARGESNSLSFRNLIPFCMVSEQSIQKTMSPLLTDRWLTATKEYSVFKLLLTGVDDSAITPEESAATRRLSRVAKIEVIDELISDHQHRLAGRVSENDDQDELQKQLGKLEESIDREQSLLNESDFTYRNVKSSQSQLLEKLQSAQERQVEVDELLNRFQLLDEHYNSDLQRLKGIREAGALVATLENQTCPLCGTPADQQHKDSTCDGNIETVVKSVDAEREKIHTLMVGLATTVSKLHSEKVGFNELVSTIEQRISEKDLELAELNPLLLEARAVYTELLNKRATVQNVLDILNTIAELRGRKAELEAPVERVEETEQQNTDLSQVTLNEFSKVYEEILQSWNFPDAERVHFDTQARDFVISGKPRGARGKGMRAITHAAFNVALLDYTIREALPHPGFVILDTPLLAYREPEGDDDDDLSGTDVHERFFRNLERFDNRQVIIFENIDPPKNGTLRIKYSFFSKNENSKRYGFFPTQGILS